MDPTTWNLCAKAIVLPGDTFSARSHQYAQAAKESNYGKDQWPMGPEMINSSTRRIEVLCADGNERDIREKK